MEEEKQTTHKCFTCDYYIPYYAKKETCFERTTDGKCEKCRQLKDHKDYCEEWKSKPLKYYYSSKHGITRVIRDLLSQLTALRQILQEEENAKKR